MLTCRPCNALRNAFPLPATSAEAPISSAHAARSATTSRVATMVRTTRGRLCVIAFKRADLRVRAGLSQPYIVEKASV